MIPGIFAGAMGQGGGGGTDPHWANVVSLLHFDGSDGSSTFTDQKGHSWTRNNSNAALSTDDPKFGSAALRLAVSGAYISRPITANDNFGTGDLTIEMWRRFDSTGRQYMYAMNGNDAAIIFTPSSGALEIYGPSSFVINAGSTPLSAGAWRHFALTREGNVWRFFVNGTLYQSTTDSRSWGATAGIVTIATPDGLTSNATGYFDDVRVTKGVARYTSDFTPPTEAFPNA